MSRRFGAFIDNEAKGVRDDVKAASQHIIAAPDPARLAEWRDKVAPNNAAYVKSVPEGETIFAAYQQFLAKAKSP